MSALPTLLSLLLLPGCGLVLEASPGAGDASVGDATSRRDAIEGDAREDVAGEGDAGSNDGAPPDDASDRDAAMADGSTPRDGAADGEVDASIPPRADRCVVEDRGPVVMLDARDLAAAIESLEEDSTLVIPDGVILRRTAHVRARRVVIRGPSGGRAHVDATMVEGPAFEIAASDVTLADLVIEGADTGVAVHGEDDRNVRGARLIGLHVLDARHSSIHVSSARAFRLASDDGETDDYADDGEVGCSLFETSPALRESPACQIQDGLMFESASGWNVHDNEIRDLRCAVSTAVEGIFLRHRCSDFVITRNVIVNAWAGIRVGWDAGRADDASPTFDPRPLDGCAVASDPAIPLDAVRVEVSNNFIDAYDVVVDGGISVWQACDVDVRHNTVMTGATYSGIEGRYASTRASFAANLVSQAFNRRDCGAGCVVTDEVMATIDVVRRLSPGDLHLVEGAALTLVPRTLALDFDRETRGEVTMPGADEPSRGTP